MPAQDHVMRLTQAWLNRAVIGLNLCPFAKAVQTKDQIRAIYSAAQDPQTLLDTLCSELHYLAEANPDKTDTTLIVHPQVLADFLDFNDFLELADNAVDSLGYSGILQVASFHPQFQFAGSAAGDVSNATNQSPYPMLHILREASVERAVAAFPDPEAIYAANMRALNDLGPQGWAAILALCERDAQHNPNNGS
jgi:uncharacterized protein